MWRNPKYYAQARETIPSQAPEDTGRNLATLPRSVRGVEEELRISLAEFQGHAYLSIRVWALDKRSGQYWPVKGKGCSVRLREAQDVAAALLEGLRIAEAEMDRPTKQEMRGAHHHGGDG